MQNRGRVLVPCRPVLEPAVPPGRLTLVPQGFDGEWFRVWDVVAPVGVGILGQRAAVRPFRGRLPRGFPAPPVVRAPRVALTWAWQAALACAL